MDICLSDLDPIDDRPHIKIGHNLICFIDLIEMFTNGIPDEYIHIELSELKKILERDYRKTKMLQKNNHSWINKKGIVNPYTNTKFSNDEKDEIINFINANCNLLNINMNYWFRYDNHIYNTNGDKLLLNTKQINNTTFSRQKSFGGLKKKSKIKNKNKNKSKKILF